MQRRFAALGFVTAMLLIMGNCEFGIEPVIKPDFQGVVNLVPGDTVILALSPVILPDDTIFSYQITSTGDTNVARLIPRAGDSLQIAARDSGVSFTDLLVFSGGGRLTVRLELWVSPRNQSGYLNRVRLGDTLSIRLGDYGIPDAETVDSIVVNFTTAGICTFAGLDGGSIRVAGIKPGSTQMRVSVWQAGVNTTLELQLHTFIRRTALVELFTNAGCVPCAPANQLLDDFRENDTTGTLSIIRYHVNWPSPNDPMYHYNPSESVSRVMYYGIVQAPTLIVDGKLTAQDQSFWPQQIRQAGSVESQMTVSIVEMTPVDSDSVAVEFRIQSYAPGDLTGLRIMSVVTEDSVEFAGENGEDIHMQVMRDYVVTTPVSLVAEGELTGVNRLKWRAGNGNPARYVVTVFIQSDADKMILQATQKSLY